jgi:hypothetical protein
MEGLNNIWKTGFAVLLLVLSAFVVFTNRGVAEGLLGVGVAFVAGIILDNSLSVGKTVGKSK